MSEERENQKESDHGSSSLRIHSSNISEQSVSSELKGKKPSTKQRPCTPPQLHVEPKAVIEKRKKATSMQMEKEWKNSPLYINDLNVVISMRETGLYKNVSEQYNWYLDQVAKKHSDKLRTRIAQINEEGAKQGQGVIVIERGNLAEDLADFQYEYRSKLTGRRGGVYMGFSKHEVKEQFGLPLERLLIFVEGSDWYRQQKTSYTMHSSRCLIAQLKTRMMCHDNVLCLNLINSKLPSVLSEAVEVISKLTTTTSDTLKGFTQNTTVWQKSEEYHLHTEMVEKSKEVSLFKCIDLYFQWYMKLVSEKHADKFTQRIADINKASSKVPNGYTIIVVDNNLALGLLGFQVHYKDALENGEVCMGFSKREVDEQYGIALESLFTLNTYARKYSESGITTRGPRSDCIVSELITRMKNAKYRTYQREFNQSMVPILYKTLEVVSEITTLPSEFDVELHLQMLREVEEDKHMIVHQQEKNTNHGLSNLMAIQERLELEKIKTDKEWQKTEEYRLHADMVEKSKEVSLFKCIDLYFQWYMKLVSEKHADKFTQRIADINTASSKVPNGYTISVVDNNLALGLLGFQVHYKDALENGEVCMGFSKREVDEQYGIALESLFTLSTYARKYSESGITTRGPRSDCIVRDLITRMKNAKYRTYQRDFNQNMVEILYKTLEMVSNLTAPNSKLYVKLQEALQVFGGKASLETCMQMEKEWKNSPLYINDLNVVISMRETGLYKNVSEQYNWYLDQVAKKHSDKLRTRIAQINEEGAKQGQGVIVIERGNLAEDLADFQYEYRSKLTGRRGGVYMGFSKHEVKEQFGLPLERLLIFVEGSDWYRQQKTSYTMHSSRCLIAQLKTRMMCHDNVLCLNLINSKLPSVLSEAVEVISKLTTTTSDTL